MESKDNNQTYFLSLNRESISSPFRLFRRLGVKPLFDEDELFKKSAEDGIDEIKLLIHNKKAWTWESEATENKPENLKDISSAEMLRILGLPAANKIPSLGLNDILKDEINDIYWLDTDKNIPRTEVAGQCYQLGLIYENELEGLANYPWPIDRLLVVNNKIYGSQNTIGKEAKEELGILPGNEIRTFRMSDLIKRHEEDLSLVKNDHSTKLSYPELPEHRKTKAVTLAAIEADYQNAQYVPLDLIDQQVADAMVSRDGKALAIIPQEFISEKMCMNAVNNEGMALQYVPEKFYSNELFERAIENDGWALQFVPVEQKTKEMCHLALEQVLNMDYEGYSIAKYIPYSDICLDIFKDAMNQFDAYDVLKTFPKEKVNKEIALEAIKQDMECFGLVPQEVRTSDFYVEAVKINGWMLEHVPDEMKTPEMCRNAKDASPDLGYDYLGLVAHVPFADICIEYLKEAQGKMDIHEVFTAIPKDILNNEIVQTAVDLDASCFKFVPDNLKTEELCSKAINETGAFGDVFDHIPLGLRSDEIYKQAVSVNEFALSWVPQEKRSYEMCLSAVRRDGYQLEFVPEKIRTREICQSALDNCDKLVNIEHYSILSDIPYPDICMKVIEKFEKTVDTYFMYSTIKDIAYNEKIAARAVETDGLCIVNIPDRFITEELTLKAVSNTNKIDDLLVFIPDQFLTAKVCDSIAKQYPVKAIYRLPTDKRTPEVYLRAVNECPYLKDSIPKERIAGKNIYSFNERLEKILTDKDKLTFDQIKNIYQGDSVKVQQVKSGSQMLNDRILSYDRNMDLFVITHSQKQENKIPPSRIDNPYPKKGRGI